MPPVYAWQHLPSPAELADRPHAAEQEQHWLFCLDDDIPPPHRIALPAEPSDNGLAAALQAALACTGTAALHHFPYAWGKVHFWFVPRAYAAQCQAHFAEPIQWQDTPVRPAEPPVLKAWQAAPEPLPEDGTPHVLVIGAGIAGAATAYECALRGASVSVIERQKQPAQEASGNRQGLLYAKISPHDTPQTELLLSGYGYTRHLLARLLPEQVHWQPCGVLHLNHNESERQRNRLLAAQTQHAHLYRAVCAEEAAQLAGIPIGQDGLFWPMGAWLNPPALVKRLLNHPNIRLFAEHNVEEATYDRESRQWRVRTPHGTLSGSHIVFCTGACSLHAPITRQFPLQIIRGQTSIAPATEYSRALKTALSAASYISPAWQGRHCFGATFAPNNPDTAWQAEDERHNRQALSQLNEPLYHSLSAQWGNESSLHPTERGHAALRCDAHDHLPAVGALGDAAAMKQVYAKFAHDKNYPIQTPCPYLPNAYLNTAHGSRGLATAPLCAADIAAQICRTPRLLSARLQQALNPNRLIIKEIIHGKIGAKVR